VPWCGNDGHWPKDCYKRKSEEAGDGRNNRTREFTFLAAEEVEQPGMGWIIDSGASQHLCGDRAQFSTYSKISSEQAITIADVTRIQAVGSGEVQIDTEGGGIRVTGVCHVPDI